MRIYITGALAGSVMMLGVVCAQGGERPEYVADPTSVQTVFESFRQLQQYCHVLYADKKLKSLTAVMHCIFDGYLDALTAVHYPALDLERERVAAEFVTAEKVDQGKFSFSEGELFEAQQLSRIQSEYELRLAAVQQDIQRQKEASERAARMQQEYQQDQAAQARADEEKERRLQLCEAAGWETPTVTGSFAESMANAARARAACEAGLPPPAVPAPLPTRPVTTDCEPSGLGVTCTTQ